LLQIQARLTARLLQLTNAINEAVLNNQPVPEPTQLMLQDTNLEVHAYGQELAQLRRELDALSNS
jgi:hypothetical protein